MLRDSEGGTSLITLYATNINAQAFNAGVNPMNLSTLSSFNINSAGPVTIHSGDTTGVVLEVGAGAWASVSDRRKKMAFRDLDGEAVLHSIGVMPIQSWSYKAQGSAVRHVGPTAQDFYKAFGLGTNDTTITDIDESGIGLLAIKALAIRTEQLKQATDRIDDLEQRLAKLEALLQAQLKRAKQ